MGFVSVVSSVILVIVAACAFAARDAGDGQQGGQQSQAVEERFRSHVRELTKRSTFTAALTRAMNRGIFNMTDILNLAQEYGPPPPAPEEIQCQIAVTEYVGGTCIQWQPGRRTACQSGVRTDLYNEDCVNLFHRMNAISGDD